MRPLRIIFLIIFTAFPVFADNALSTPDKITVTGLLRRESLVTGLGLVNIRWSRSSEIRFGRPPGKAVVEAVSAAEKMLKQNSFPYNSKFYSREWNIVLVDDELHANQVPEQLVSECHPGWMTPPANIYLVAKRLTGGCQNQSFDKSRADAEVMKVLLHEIGHVVEHVLLGERDGLNQVRSEGFATWFAATSSRYTPLLNSGVETSENLKAARNWKGGWTGGREDYAMASLFFTAIEKKHGISGISSFYKFLIESKGNSEVALKRSIYWDQSTMDREVAHLLAKK